VRLALRTARRNIEFEVTLIDDLLDFTQATRGKLSLKEQQVDVHVLLGDSIDLFILSEARNKSLRFECQLGASRHHLLADGGRIQQVFCNLLKNALKFTPAGGSITLRTFDVEPDRIAIEVADTGIGIDQDVLPKLFSPFEQGNASADFGGLGLGLMISRTIIEAHCGTISATSAGRNQGTVFRVELGTLPEKRAAATGNGEEAPQDIHGLRLLLVEDHAMTREILSRLLSKHGYIVEVACDVATAKRAAQSGPFDLVLSDLGLPDGDGRQLMKHLKSHYGLRGIAFSGYGTDDDVRTSQEAGFAEHLTKPVDWARLAAAIHRVVQAA
jgi:CheY-like chemotaxis protein